MEKIAVAICGSSGIDYFCDDHKMKVFRSKILINDVEYIDYIDISVEEFYFLLKSAKTLHTTQVSTGELIDLIKSYREEGYTDLIMITISSGMSGTFQGVKLAGSNVSGINVHVFDSKTIGYPEAFLALECQKLIEKGYPVKEIIPILTDIRDHSGFRFVVDTLDYLRMNGRLSNASALIGNLLKIKPILIINDEGKVVVYEKIRTKSKAIERMLESFLEDTKDLDIDCFILYTNNYDEALELKNNLLKRTNRFKEVNLYPLPPVIGVHAGPGAFAIGYVPKMVDYPDKN